MFAVAAWPTIVYFIIMGAGLAIVLLGVWSRRNWVRPDRPLGFIKRNIGWVSIISLLAAWVFFALNVGVERRESFEMTWKYADPSPRQPNSKHIVLNFVDFPNHYIGIWSSDLGPYLETLPSKRVRVVFVVTRDFGSVRGYQEVQIGELRKWNSSGGYGGRSGDASLPSPWD